MKIPYISFVTVSRNDDYGGKDAFNRMQTVLTHRLNQLEKYNIKSELLLIDWNPPVNKPLLKDAIKWPEKNNNCTIKTIIISNEIHRKHCYGKDSPINIIKALNCGIRRARGLFVLPAHMDLLYSDQLMQFISKKTLNENFRYRIARKDVDKNIIQDNSNGNILKLCRKNILRERRPLPKEEKKLRFFRTKLPNLFTSAGGDFQLMSNYNWQLLGGYYERDVIGAYDEGLLSYASHSIGIKEVILEDPMELYHIDHEGQFIDSVKTKNNLKTSLIFKIMGENNYSIRLNGILDKILVKFKIYPKSYVNGYETLNYLEYREIVKDIINQKKCFHMNDINWGLVNEKINIEIIKLAEWDE